MLIPNRFDSLDDYRYGFQGQEKDDEIKGEGNSLNYTFKMHDSRVGRFLSLDPLSPQYPHNSPFAFCENRVIDGVELEGLEYYSANESMIEISRGLTQIRVQNLSGPSIHSLSVLRLDDNGKQTKIRDWKSDVIIGRTISIQYTPITENDNQLKALQSSQVSKTFSGKQLGSQSIDLRPEKMDGTKNKRFSKSIIGGGLNGKNVNLGIKANIGVNAVNYGLNKLHGFLISNDMSLVEEHHKTLAQKVLPALKKAIEKGDYIPRDMMNESDLSQIANVILFGGDSDYDSEIIDVGMKIYYELTEKGKSEMIKMQKITNKIKSSEIEQSQTVKDNTKITE